MGKIIMFPKKYIAENKNDSEKTFLDYLDILNKFVPIAIAGFALLTGLNTIIKFHYYGISFSFFDFDVKNAFVMYIKHIFMWLGYLYLPIITSKFVKRTNLFVKIL